jgi:hypothetical protein
MGVPRHRGQAALFTIDFLNVSVVPNQTGPRRSPHFAAVNLGGMAGPKAIQRCREFHDRFHLRA